MADPVFIQGATSANPDGLSNVSTIALAYSTANLTAGSVLVAVCTWGTGDATPTCADGTNGAWTAGPKVWDTTNGQGGACFFFTNNTSTAKPTVTVSFGANKFWRGLQIGEIGPAHTTTQPDIAAPAWRTQNAPATTTDLVASNAIVPVTNNALIYGVTFDDNGVAQSVAGTGFANRGGWTGGVPSRVEDKTLATAGSTTATFTAGAGGTRDLTAVMAIRPAAGGASDTPRTPVVGAVAFAGVAPTDVIGSIVKPATMTKI